MFGSVKPIVCIYPNKSIHSGQGFLLKMFTTLLNIAAKIRNIQVFPY